MQENYQTEDGSCKKQVLRKWALQKRRSTAKSVRLARGEGGALGGGFARHGRDFLQVEAGDEHGRWCDAAPAIQLRLGAKEFHFRAKREVENNLGGAAIELLRELQERFFAKSCPSAEPQMETSRDSCSIWSVIFRHAKKRAGSADGNVEGLAVGIPRSLVSAGINEICRGTIWFPSLFNPSVTQRESGIVTFATRTRRSR